MSSESSAGQKRWYVRSERLVDDSRRAKVSIAQVELPDGRGYEQYVIRLPRAAMVLAVDDRARVLLMWRHRFVLDRWCWELPGGYVQPGESPKAAAARELLEETGWRAAELEKLVSYQPMTGMADHECVVYLAEQAEQTSALRDPNEAESLEWIPLDRALGMVEREEILGAATVAGLLALKVRCLTRGELIADLRGGRNL